MGVPLPPPDEPLPEDIEVQLSKVVSEAAQRVLQQSQAEQSQQQAQEQAEDPIIQMRQKELEIREMETVANIEDKKARLELDQQKAMGRDALDRERIESNQLVAQAKIGASIAEKTMEIESKDGELESQEVMEGVRAGLKAQELLMQEREIDSREVLEGVKMGQQAAIEQLRKENEETEEE